MGEGKGEEPGDEKIMESESDNGNRGKYQRVKGGKTVEKSRGYGVLWKVKKRNVDMLCRPLSLKYHLLSNLKAHRMGSQESKKSVSAASYTCPATKSLLKPRYNKQLDDEVPMR